MRIWIEEFFEAKGPRYKKLGISAPDEDPSWRESDKAEPKRQMSNNSLVSGFCEYGNIVRRLRHYEGVRCIPWKACGLGERVVAEEAASY